MHTEPTPAQDNLIPYAMAAKALSCSRRTIERMVERGQLERIEGAHPAAVTRRSLTSALTQRQQVPTTQAHPNQALEGPALLVLLDQIHQANNALVAAKTAEAELRVQLRQIEANKDVLEAQAANKDVLVRDLLYGNRRERRKARKEAMRMATYPAVIEQDSQ